MTHHVVNCAVQNRWCCRLGWRRSTWAGSWSAPTSMASSRTRSSISCPGPRRVHAGARSYTLTSDEQMQHSLPTWLTTPFASLALTSAGSGSSNALPAQTKTETGARQGFVLVALGANVLFYGLFYAGRGIARTLQGGSKMKDD